MRRDGICNRNGGKAAFRRSAVGKGMRRNARCDIRAGMKA